MQRKTFKSAKALRAALEADMKTLEARTLAAVRQTAEEGAAVVRDNAPRAFGPLQDSVHAEDTDGGATIAIDAPHAASVEFGSRPHMPPLAPLIAWVQLRGMQGVEAGDRATGADRWAAGALASLGDGMSTPTDATVRVARAIQLKIAREGTPPQFFVAKSMPDIQFLLDVNVKAALAEPL